MMPAYRYLVIEGPIGAGKTSLARALAERFSCRLELEESTNPFLKDFYKDRRALAFETQVFFLLSRHQRQRELEQEGWFEDLVVADYFFAKDRIFAYVNLDDEEILIYEKIYRLLDPKVVRPDLVVYLQAQSQVLMKRISSRAITFETDMEEEYVEKVSQAYSRFFFNYKETPLLRVNTTHRDFVNNQEDLDGLIADINCRAKGILY